MPETETEPPFETFKRRLLMTDLDLSGRVQEKRTFFYSLYLVLTLIFCILRTHLMLPLKMIDLF